LYSKEGYLGYSSNATGTATITGAGSAWTNSGTFYVGYNGTGILTLEDGGQVTSPSSRIAFNPNSIGSVTVTGTGSAWTIGGGFAVGHSGSGTLNIESGGQVYSSSCLLGSETGSTGKVTVRGNGSKWTNNTLYVGFTKDNGYLCIEANAQVNCSTSIIGPQGTVIVRGPGSNWTNTRFDSTQGAILNIESGGVVDCINTADYPVNFGGKLTVSGADSQFIVNQTFNFSGGSMNIENGGLVTDLNCKVMSSCVITVNGANSKWINSQDLKMANGTLNIEAGGYVSNSIANTATATVSGVDSVWDGSTSITVNSLTVGKGIGSGGLVMTKALSVGTGNLNGGSLKAETIFIANCNWDDGLIKNYDSNTDLTLNGGCKLAATGTHAILIDQGRQGTVNGTIGDATSGGTLVKLGGGKLTLASNNYTGSTTIAEGTLAFSSLGRLASNLIDVQSGATFDVSAKSVGCLLAANQTLTGSGVIVGNMIIKGIHDPGSSPGIETMKGNYSLLGELKIDLLGTNVGTEYDEVLISGSSAYDATLGGTLTLNWGDMSDAGESAKLWILKNDTAGTLSGTFSNYANGASLGTHGGLDWRIYYNADAASGNPTGGNDVLIAPVPEPATIVLLALSALAMLAWRRKSRVGPA
jgi:T5SS/PEP-CTERM-associated repeat protein/autotransporter-associated beta strand protein